MSHLAPMAPLGCRTLGEALIVSGVPSPCYSMILDLSFFFFYKMKVKCCALEEGILSNPWKDP